MYANRTSSFNPVIPKNAAKNLRKAPVPAPAPAAPVEHNELAERLKRVRPPDDKPCPEINKPRPIASNSPDWNKSCPISNNSQDSSKGLIASNSPEWNKSRPISNNLQDSSKGPVASNSPEWNKSRPISNNSQDSSKTDINKFINKTGNREKPKLPVRCDSLSDINFKSFNLKKTGVDLTNDFNKLNESCNPIDEMEVKTIGKVDTSFLEHNNSPSHKIGKVNTSFLENNNSSSHTPNDKPVPPFKNRSHKPIMEKPVPGVKPRGKVSNTAGTETSNIMEISNITAMETDLLPPPPDQLLEQSDNEETCDDVDDIYDDVENVVNVSSLKNELSKTLEKKIGINKPTDEPKPKPKPKPKTFNTPPKPSNYPEISNNYPKSSPDPTNYTANSSIIEPDDDIYDVVENIQPDVSVLPPSSFVQEQQQAPTPQVIPNEEQEIYDDVASPEQHNQPIAPGEEIYDDIDAAKETLNTQASFPAYPAPVLPNISANDSNRKSASGLYLIPVEEIYDDVDAEKMSGIPFQSSAPSLPIIPFETIVPPTLVKNIPQKPLKTFAKLDSYRFAVPVGLDTWLYQMLCANQSRLKTYTTFVANHVDQRRQKDTDTVSIQSNESNKNEKDVKKEQKKQKKFEKEKKAKEQQQKKKMERDLKMFNLEYDDDRHLLGSVTATSENKGSKKDLAYTHADEINIFQTNHKCPDGKLLAQNANSLRFGYISKEEFGLSDAFLAVDTRNQNNQPLKRTVSLIPTDEDEGKLVSGQPVVQQMPPPVPQTPRHPGLPPPVPQTPRPRPFMNPGGTPGNPAQTLIEEDIYDDIGEPASIITEDIYEDIEGGLAL